MLCIFSTLIMVDEYSLGIAYPDNINPYANVFLLLDEGKYRGYFENYIELGNVQFHLNNFYNGKVFFYTFLVPITFVVGLGTHTVVIAGILAVLGTAIFTFLFGNKVFGEPVGLIASAIFLFMPATIFFGGKLAVWSDFTLAFWAISSLYFFSRWQNTQSKKNLILAFFLLGIGFSTKTIFVWFGVSIFTTFLLLRPKLHLNIKNLSYALPSLLGGLALLIISWINMGTYMFNRLDLYSETSRAGIDNTSYLSNLQTRIEQFSELLSGSNFSMFGGPYSNDLFLMIFAVSAVTCTLFALKFFKINNSKIILLPVIIIGVVLLVSPVTISTFKHMHLIILLPFVSLCMAIFITKSGIFLGNLSRFFKLKNKMQGKILAWSFIILISALLIFTNIHTTYLYKDDLKNKGATGPFSTEIFEVGKYLVDNNYNEVMVFDNGLIGTIPVVSEGLVSTTGNFLFGTSQWRLDEFETILTDSLSEDIVYGFCYSPSKIKTFDIASEIIKKHNKEFEFIKEFDNNSNCKLYRISSQN